MTARDHILAAVRRNAPPALPLPDLNGPWIAYDDPLSQFSAVLESIGGRCVRVDSVTDVERELITLPQFAAAEHVVSNVAGIPSRGIDLSAIADPHELENLGFAVLKGHFGVAENAAVWVTDDNLPHRVIYFLCEHLALVIPATEIVNTMHEAYGRVRIEPGRFGTFLAGPSKTADIEQSLVIGAHGPKSLTVFLVNSAL